ncbi:MAG: electron transport complex subunit RsxC [Rhodospirillales bacterium]|nr:electron transport complex subunit RsxC [Rhodospirillales bacterium]
MGMMKLFRIRGGVHPQGRKSLSAGEAIRDLPLPELLHIPLQQHIGQAAEAVVKKGELVKKGQLIAIAQGRISSPIHAPTSGEIVALGRYVAPHPSALPGRTITLRPDGLDAWAELPAPLDPFTCEPAAIAKRVAECGVVGMGGATFPSAVKLDLGQRYTLHTLIINGAECEPYLTCDDRLMREQAADVIDGVRIISRALGVKRAVIAVEGNKPEAIDALTHAAQGLDDVIIQKVPARYPMGSEKHLTQTLLGKETPARGLTAEIGAIVHNVATALAVRDAVRLGRPLISRIVTVSGEAMHNPGNFRVAIGTPIQHLIDFVGGFKVDPERLLLGGPMMGQPLADLRAPIVKGTNGVLALAGLHAQTSGQQGPCIRCASCVDACPCGLVPLEMAGAIRKENMDMATKSGLMDCIGCGSCAYVCPSNIPLVQYFNYAKGKITQTQRAEHKQKETKRLAEARSERMERIAQAKREAMAKRKAEQARQKAEAVTHEDKVSA